MELKDIFSKEANTSEFNLFNASPSQLGRLAFSNVAFNINNPWVEIDAINPQHKKDKQKEEAKKDLAQLALDAVQQAYEQFKIDYAAAMAFYHDAEQRLQGMEARINKQLAELDSQTELLTGSKGEAVFLDENRQFYRMENERRVLITEEDEIESLKSKIQTIEETGKTVRSESQQNDYLYLSNLLADKMDLDKDLATKRSEAKDLNAEVEQDHNKAPEASKQMSQDREDIKREIDELENRFDSFEATRNKLDQQQTANHAPNASFIDNHLDDFSNKAPTSGFDLS